MGAIKKACANCTCGRAEEEAAGIKAELTPDMLDNPQSACGSVSPHTLPLPARPICRWCNPYCAWSSSFRCLQSPCVH